MLRDSALIAASGLDAPTAKRSSTPKMRRTNGLRNANFINPVNLPRTFHPLRASNSLKALSPLRTSKSLRTSNSLDIVVDLNAPKTGRNPPQRQRSYPMAILAASQLESLTFDICRTSYCQDYNAYCCMPQVIVIPGDAVGSS